MACGPEPGVCGLVGRWRPRGGRGADMLWGPGACRPPAPPAGVDHPVVVLAHPRLVARCAEPESEPADRRALRVHPPPAYPGWASSCACTGGRAVVGVECGRSPCCVK